MTCKKRHRIVAIHWLDAESTGGWSEDDPSEKPWIMVSVGIYIRKDKHFLHYADTHIGDKEYGNKSKIPLGMIQKIVDLARLECCGYALED